MQVVLRVLVLSVLCLVSFHEPVSAQADEAAVPRWSNATELSLVATAGNTATWTFGFANTLQRTWDSARLRTRFDGVRTESASDRFLLVEPGLRFPVGDTPTDPAVTKVTPAIEPDVEQFYAEARLDKEITEQLFWNVGASWDRNSDAGILNRAIVFAGVGNVWASDDDVAFSTSYGVSYTNREESAPDPLKEGEFAGLRTSTTYKQRFGAVTTDNDTTVNMSFVRTSDYSVNTTSGVGVSMGRYLSLRVSLQLLFENEPGLEDADIVGRVRLLDPDGVPGTGDELFETVADGGSQIALGKGQIRKDPLDTVLRTALVISF